MGDGFLSLFLFFSNPNSKQGKWTKAVRPSVVSPSEAIKHTYRNVTSQTHKTITMAPSTPPRTHQHRCRWQNCAQHKDRNATISPLKELPSINASAPFPSPTSTANISIHIHHCIRMYPYCIVSTSTSNPMRCIHSTNRKTTHSTVTAIQNLVILAIGAELGIREGGVEKHPKLFCDSVDLIHISN